MDLAIRKITQADSNITSAITAWMYEWWGKQLNRSEAEIRLFTESGFQENRLPQTYGLFLSDTLIGIYQFRLDDMFVRPDIYPWLANVYIDKPYRNRGYSKILLESVKEQALHNLSSSELYLYTKHIGLYEKYGWEFISEIDTYAQQDRFQRLYKMKLN